MDLKILYESMFNAVVSGGLQKIINSAYKIINLPMLVVDTSYNVLAVTDSGIVKDNIWNSLIAKRHASPELVWLFHENKYIESVGSSFKPVYLNWGSLEIPQVSGAIRVNGIIRGFIGVVCPESEFSDELIEAIAIVTDALAIDMKNHKSDNTQDNPLLEIFTRDLLNDNFHSEEQLETWKSNFGHVFKRSYMLAAILPPSEGEYGLLQYFSRNMTSKYHNVLSTILKDTLFLLFYDLRNEGELEEMKREIIKNSSSFHSHCSITKIFSNILDVPSYRFQLEKALELGNLLHPEERVYYYEDYIIPTIFSYSLKEMKPLSYMHPMIKELKEFDLKNNTDYLKTLETYILYICDSRRVSEKLHIHRNTLLYRLNRISEITKCDLEDEKLCTQLMFSFQMLKLKKQLTSELI